VASVGAHETVSSKCCVECVLQPSSNELVVVCNGCCGCALDGWSDEVKEALRELRLADFSLPSRLISAVEELFDFRGTVDLELAFLVLRTGFVSGGAGNDASASLLTFTVDGVVATVESCGSTVTALSRTRRLIGEAGAPCPLPLSIKRAARADVQAMPVKKLLPPNAPCSIFLAMLLSKAARAEPIRPFFMIDTASYWFKAFCRD
jgi:hypothetical protein